MAYDAGLLGMPALYFLWTAETNIVQQGRRTHQFAFCPLLPASTHFSYTFHHQNRLFNALCVGVLLQVVV